MIEGRSAYNVPSSQNIFNIDSIRVNFG